MKQSKNLFILSGIPGSGKTTWIKNYLEGDSRKSIHISRDEIRFAMVSESEEYFSKENLVFKEFCSQIQSAINDGYENIFVDATHLNEKARNKVLDTLTLKNVSLKAVNFEVPLNTCLERNAQRSGRAVVPSSVIRSMFNSFSPTKKEEKYKYAEIITVK